MSSGSYLQADVQCPFYRFDDRRRIVCEGAAQGAVSIQMFKSRAECEEHMLRFCCRSYECCPLQKGLMTKYEEDDKL